jgi:hypothetical protein
MRTGIFFTRVNVKHFLDIAYVHQFLGWAIRVALPVQMVKVEFVNPKRSPKRSFANDGFVRTCNQRLKAFKLKMLICREQA